MVSTKDPAEMTERAINRERAALEERSGEILDGLDGEHAEMPYRDFVASGHPDAAEYDAITKRQRALYDEIESRYKESGTGKRPRSRGR